jgi:flagellar hook-associated protein 1 FlgK
LLNTISAGQSGLRAASEALNVIGQNTANAATEGYSRQTITTSAANPYSRDGLWLGAGVSVDSVGRVTDIFVAERLTDARGDASSAEASYKAHQVIEASVASDNGPAAALDAFFDALDTLRSDPASTGSRLAAISAGEELATSVTTTFSQLSAIQDGYSEQISTSAAGINRSLERIADLNGLVGQGGSSDLADERDRLINDLADTLGVTVDVSSASGEATVFLGGHAIVMGDNHRSVDIRIGTDGPIIDISADDASITVTDDVGGSIGGLMQAWQTAEDTQSDLNAFVEGFSDAFNDQHAAGFDATGSPGGAFFTFSGPDPAAGFAVSGAISADDSLLALADDPAALAGDKGNLTALSSLQDTELIDGLTPSRFMERMYTRVGDAVQRAETNYITESAALSDARALQDATSGVSLDEEAADLLQWQAAYQAAARVITASNELMSELMNMAR